MNSVEREIKAIKDEENSNKDSPTPKGA